MEYNKYKGLYIPGGIVKGPVSEIGNVDELCSAFSAPGSSGDCDGIECNKCVLLGTPTVDISLEYLVNEDYVSKKDALDITLKLSQK